MKTSELTGALLEYWTARAEGHPPEELTIRRNQVFRQHHDPKRHGGFARVLDYTTNWALTGPLLEKWCKIDTAQFDGVLFFGDHWEAPYTVHGAVVRTEGEGDTPLIAICRAVVRAAFGDEVEDIQ